MTFNMKTLLHSISKLDALHLSLSFKSATHSRSALRSVFNPWSLRQPPRRVSFSPEPVQTFEEDSLDSLIHFTPSWQRRRRLALAWHGSMTMWLPTSRGRLRSWLDHRPHLSHAGLSWYGMRIRTTRSLYFLGAGFFFPFLF